MDRQYRAGRGEAPLQVTDKHFIQAVQNPVQQPAARARTALQSANIDAKEDVFCGLMREEADLGEFLEPVKVGAGGFEPP